VKGHGQKLTRKQEAVIAALLAHPSIDAAARTAGVSPRTVKNYLAYEPFKRAYAEARRRGIEYVQEAREEPVIATDGDRVLQIISNLLANAFRWTPDGGRIDLSLSSANGSVTVDVADTGPGIGAEERERIFRPFWSRDGRGTGLGLPIARELAVALGGRIDLESTVGSGSRNEDARS
jgi:signal transduction histidine kinase